MRKISMMKNNISLRFLKDNIKDNVSFSYGSEFNENYKFEERVGIVL